MKKEGRSSELLELRELLSPDLKHTNRIEELIWSDEHISFIFNSSRLFYLY